ncbi:MAG: hypothetical protein IT304_04860 [Dehalococcoidia bacterium]|nr:hypothetical protein [Dehalococcoidia bacterium]
MTTPGREYAPKPAEGTLERALAARPRGERPRLKAEALATANAGLRSFAYGDIAIEVTRGPEVTPDGLLAVWVQASRGGLPIPVDNPYLFRNPPILASNGTWRREVDAEGSEIDRPNVEENLAGAFREIVGLAVATVATVARK